MSEPHSFANTVPFESFTPLMLSPKMIDSVQVTIINQFFPPDYAATGQLIAELAHQLKGSFRLVEVFSSQPSYAFKQQDLPRWEHQEAISIRRSKSVNVSYGRIRGKALSGVLFFLRAIIHLLRASSRRQVVLLTTAPPFLPLAGLFVSCFCKISYVCLLYDLYPDIAINLGVVKKQGILAKTWDFLNCLTWKKSAAIIVLNSSMKDRIINKCPQVAHKISVIPNWSDPQEIQPMAKEVNSFAHAHDLVDLFTVMYSGNMGRCHDVETLLNAIILLRNAPIKFVFVGGGDKRKYMQSKIEEHGLTNCLMLPYQPKEKLTFSLTACDVSLVSIDERMEGLVAPSKLYSYLAAASPIVAICPEHSYLNTVLAEAECGAGFCNGDSQGLANYLYKLSQDPQLVKDLGQSGREYCVQNYTLEKTANEYLQLFKSLVERQLS
jgi:glycosyltransferase involved in cell wall biosynthesis